MVHHGKRGNYLNKSLVHNCKSGNCLNKSLVHHGKHENCLNKSLAHYSHCSLCCSCFNGSHQSLPILTKLWNATPTPAAEPEALRKARNSEDSTAARGGSVGNNLR
ncbi:hypothetical protein Lal_00000844 [Lupinus albus]|nr:hypothetical protein Lal_00000844 [Lupinus albus]